MPTGPGYTESERAVPSAHGGGLQPRRKARRGFLLQLVDSPHATVIDLAQEYGRNVAVVGTQHGQSVTEIAHSLGLLDIPDGILMRPQDAMDLPRQTRSPS